MRYALIALCVLLSGCDTRPEHAEWRTECIASHDETYSILVPMSFDGKTTILMPQAQVQTICDQYAPVCVPGKDGSTECE